MVADNAGISQYTTRENHQYEAAQQHHGLKDGHMFLEPNLVPKGKDFTLGLLALCLEGDDRRLPNLVIVLADSLQLREDGIVEIAEEGVHSGYLLAFHLFEGFLEKPGLLLNILQRHGGVRFEELESLRDAFEERLLNRRRGRRG